MKKFVPLLTKEKEKPAMNGLENEDSWHLNMFKDTSVLLKVINIWTSS